MALWRVASAAGQQRERGVEPLQEAIGTEDLRPGRGQLDSQWQPVEPAADRLDRVVGRQLAADRQRALGEQRRGVPDRKRLQTVLVLARDPERRAAGHEHADAATRADHRAHGRGGVEQMLEVVEEEQQPPAPEEAAEVVGRPDRLRDLRVEELGIGEPGERHPEDSVALGSDELGRDLERESRLSGAARPRHGDEARAVGQQRGELVDLPLPADERARREREVRRIQAAQRREVAVAELVEPLGVGKVLQPVLSEVAEGCIDVEEPSRGLGDDDLSSVRRGGDASGAVDVHAHVPLLRAERLARVDPHADADRAGFERCSRFVGGGDSVGRS